jgi:hypothetical protein
LLKNAIGSSTGVSLAPFPSRRAGDIPDNVQPESLFIVGFDKDVVLSPALGERFTCFLSSQYNQDAVSMVGGILIEPSESGEILADTPPGRIVRPVSPELVHPSFLHPLRIVI